MFKRSASQSRNDSEDGGGIDSDSRSNLSTGNYSSRNTPNLSSRQQSPAISRSIQVCESSAITKFRLRLCQEQSKHFVFFIFL